MTLRRWARAAIAVALVPPLLVIQATTPAQAEAAPDVEKASKVAVAGRAAAPKNLTSRLAQSDPALLERRDTAAVQILVKLDYDSVATYGGGVRGLAATSPSVTGRPLRGGPEEKRYRDHVTGVEDRFLTDLSKRVPNVAVGQRLRTVYGGVALTLPANRVRDVAAIGGVVAVQADEVRKPLTDSSPDFIGATALYPRLGGVSDAGKGVIFGVLDTGAWPEHPSLTDQGNIPAPPPKADGTPRVCNFGDNPLTPANDPFACNDKLISGQPFLATYLSDPTRAANEPYKTARDSNGHGTHTGTTAAGNALASAPVLGVDRGPVNGVAPGAHVAVYKVCGIQGCFASDSAAAVGQAILDGADVLNFSISGGTNPFTDPAELAFLDAYAAGVFVAAAAGNEGPGPNTANHLAPWVTAVGASTQRREFRSTLTLTGSDGATATFTGASITAGAGPAPVVLASAAPYGRPLCDAPAPPGTFTGKIVACQRGGNPRVEKGYNVAQGGAVGMILYNPTLADTVTDNHWLPTVHLADGRPFLAFMAAHPGVVGAFTPGQKAEGQPDVMAAFSSRGPAGHFLKPDVTAPGVQILAGHTPTPEPILGGPPGQYFEAIAGTSMASPHVAGAAILLRALHPRWTPGQIKSALMTTANTRVVKEDTVTPADPFDRGAGRIDLRVAGDAGLTFDESAARMMALGNNPVNAVHLNLPSIHAPVMPGRLTTVRTAVNTTGQRRAYRVSTVAPERSSITVQPSSFTLDPGQSVQLRITIRSTAPTAQYFGEVRLTPVGGGSPALHLPVAFVPKQGPVSLTSQCAPDAIRFLTASVCTVTAQNTSFGDAEVDLRTTTSYNLPVIAASGAVQAGPYTVIAQDRALPGVRPGVPSLQPGTIAGYLPLARFGFTPDPIGDEEIINYDLPRSVTYTGQRYNRVGVTSNGYLVVGGGGVEDIECCDLRRLPDPARPNNVLAPFWTDLDGTGAPGILAGILRNNATGAEYLVIEWQVNVFGTTSNRHFQVWMRMDGPEEVAFAYDPAARPAPQPGMPFLVGAENADGSGGDQLDGPPTQDLRVVSTAPTPGGSASYTLTVLGAFPGTGTVTTTMDTPAVPGTTVVTSNVVVSWQDPTGRYR
jgi:subtilisin family serine protease